MFKTKRLVLLKMFISVAALVSISFCCLSSPYASDSTVFDPTLKQVTIDNVSGVPVGTIGVWYESIPPNGWLECNGQSTIGYPKLRAKMSRTPNFGDNFLRPRGGGRSIGSTQGDAIRNIRGEFDGNINDKDYKKGAFYAKEGAYGSDGDKGGGLIVFDASRVVPTADENRPKNIAVMYIIKAE